MRPTAPPVDVLFIIAALSMLAGTLQAAGGLDYLVAQAEKLIRRNPNHITLIAPFVCLTFTLFTGTAYVAMSLFPVIAEVAYGAGVRVERPLATSVIASKCGCTGSPVSAATAAMIGLLAVQGVTLGHVLSVAIPAVIVGIFVSCLVMYRHGKELSEDEEFQKRLAAGEIAAYSGGMTRTETFGRSAKLSVLIFGFVVASIIVLGSVKSLMPAWQAGGKVIHLSIPYAIQLAAMTGAFIIVLACKVKPRTIVNSSVFGAGMTGFMSILGIAWMADTFFHAHQAVLTAAISGIAQAHPWLFALVLFFSSSMLFSQGATVRAIMPLGLALGIPASYLVAMFPACNGTFFFPATGVVVGAIGFDRSGTTRIGNFVLNHSFMLPGVVGVASAVAAGFAFTFLFY